MAEPIYRTVYQVEVFSRGPFAPSDEGGVLEEIAYATSEGDCIGDVAELSKAVVPEERVRDELLRIGNTGSFFDLDEPPELDAVAGGDA